MKSGIPSNFDPWTERSQLMEPAILDASFPLQYTSLIAIILDATIYSTTTYKDLSRRTEETRTQ